MRLATLLSRRRLLLALGAGGIALGSAGIAFTLRRGGVELRLDEHFDPVAVKSLGSQWLFQATGERDPAVLREALFGDVEFASLDEVRRHLSERITRDFETGNVTTLNGWILSHTEARLCALFVFEDTVRL